MNSQEEVVGYISQGFSMKPELRARIRKAAQAKQWPLSFIAREAFEEWLEKNGFGHEESVAKSA